MSLTKEDLVNSIRNQFGLSRNKSIQVVESFLEIMKETLENGEDILIYGFGKFCVKDKNERRGRNPYIGNDLILDARRVVTFKCSGVLRDRINGSE